MDDKLFAEKLASFKQNEKPEAVLLVADDAQKTKLLIAWTSMEVTRVNGASEPKGETENDIWQWLWKNIHYDSKDLLTKSATSSFGFDQQLKFLIGNRLIYPDGTIHSFVQRYLREKVLQLFSSSAKSQKKK
jgi:hypothetical protein